MDTEKYHSPLDIRAHDVPAISDQYKNAMRGEITAARISFIDTLPGILAVRELIQARLKQNPAATPEYTAHRLSVVAARQKAFSRRLARREVAPRLIMPDSAIVDCRDLVAETGVAEPDSVTRKQAEHLLQARENGWDITMARAESMRRRMGKMVSMILFQGPAPSEDSGLYCEYELSHSPHETWQSPAPAEAYQLLTEQLRDSLLSDDQMLDVLKSAG